MSDLYPNLGLIQEPQTPKSLCKIFYPVKSSKGKNSIEVSEQSKLTLSKLIILQADYFYNSYCLSQALHLLSDIIKKVEQNLDDSKNFLQMKQSEVTSEIMRVNSDLEQFEAIYSQMIHLDPKSFGLVKIDSITEVGDIKENIENRLKFEEKAAETLKTIEYLKKFQVLLEAKSARLYSEAFENMGEMLEEIRKINDFFQLLKDIETELNSIKTVEHQMEKPFLLNNLANHLYQLKNIEYTLNGIQRKNVYFRWSLKDLENHPKLYEQLISQHKILAVQKVLEQVYFKDLENLLTLKLLYSQQVKEYSNTWLLKHFQKNICLINDETSNLYDYFDRLQLKTSRDFESGVLKIELIGNYLPNLRPVTVSNYKSEFITDKYQEVIKDNIEILHLNLKKLFDMVASLTIINSLTISFKDLKLDPIKKAGYIESMPKELKLISSKIQQIQKSFDEIKSSLSTFKIITSEGLALTPRIEIFFDKLEDDYSHKVTRQAKNGFVGAALMTPKFSRMDSSQFFKFPNHKNFKGLRSAQIQNLAQIKSIEDKLNFTKSITEKISKLESELLDVKAPASLMEQFEPISLDFLANNWLQLISTEKMQIKKKNFFAAFGAVFQTMNIWKSGFIPKKIPPHLRTKVTLSQFFKAFIEGVSNRGRENSVTNVESLFSKNELAIGSFVFGIVNEEIVGSFLDDSQSIQQLKNGIVEENWGPAIMKISEFLAFLMLVQNKKNLSDWDWLKSIEKMEKKFFDVLKEFDESLLKKIMKVSS